MLYPVCVCKHEIRTNSSLHCCADGEGAEVLGAGAPAQEDRGTADDTGLLQVIIHQSESAGRHHCYNRSLCKAPTNRDCDNIMKLAAVKASASLLVSNTLLFLVQVTSNDTMCGVQGDAHLAASRNAHGKYSCRGYAIYLNSALL